MSEKFDNIDELFQDRFSGFEADVDPSVWQAVQSQIPQAGTPVPDAGASQAAGKTILGQFSASTIITVTSIAAAAVIAFGVYNSSSEEEASVQLKEELVEQGSTPIQNETVNVPESTEQDLVINEDKENSPLEEDKDYEQPQEVIQQNDPPGSIEVQAPDQKLVNDGPENGAIEEQILPDAPTQPEPNGSLTEKDPVENENDPVQDPKPIEEIIPEPAPEIILADIEHEKVDGSPFSVRFNNLGQGSYHEWEIDGVQSIEDSPEFTFNGPGEYNVKLTVRSQDGRTHTDDLIVNVMEPSVLNDIPNVFSPNGDNMNETLDISGTNMEQVTIKVYNMNSKLLFQSNSFDNDWAGNDMGGRPLPQGNYVVTVEAIGHDGENHPGYAIINLRR